METIIQHVLVDNYVYMGYCPHYGADCREEAILLLSITYLFASSVYFIKSKFTTN